MNGKPIKSAAQGCAISKAKAFWLELPCGQEGIDQVHSELCEWGRLAGRPVVGAADNGRNHFLDSPVHNIECVLILRLMPYVLEIGSSSEIFRDSNELMHASTGHIFQCDLSRAMAEALSLCYEFETPWEMKRELAEKYVDKLIEQLKKVAFHQEAARGVDIERELTTIKEGPKKRTDVIDKNKFISWVKEKNIVVDKIKSLLNDYKTCWPLENVYTNETIKNWYKEAMPNVKLKGGRPKK